jgi:hypothetical protein
MSKPSKPRVQKMAKIIQLLLVPATAFNRYELDVMYALCADGSMWWRNVDDDDKRWIPDGEQMPREDKSWEEDIKTPILLRSKPHEFKSYTPCVMCKNEQAKNRHRGLKPNYPNEAGFLFGTIPVCAEHAADLEVNNG